MSSKGRTSIRTRLASIGDLEILWFELWSSYRDCFKDEGITTSMTHCVLCGISILPQQVLGQWWCRECARKVNEREYWLSGVQHLLKVVNPLRVNHYD